jgi:hypothetical protein
MPSRLRERKPTAHIRDFIEGDAQVIALEGFRPMPIGHEVERGRFYRLSDELVRQYPAYFAVLVPVSQVIGEIER